jgi:cytochrome o ubiquinol oxidase subunit III
MSAQAPALESPGLGVTLASGAEGPAPVGIVVSYGFWIFLLSDIIMFSALFASYAVLSGQTAGGPSPKELFALRHVAIETLCLLFSSYACGLGMVALRNRSQRGFYIAFGLTFVLGATFLALEFTEFAGMVARGAGPSHSAFLSAFFALVGLHGAHVTAGLIWLCFMVAQFSVQGPRDYVRRRLLCFGLFWHALDIIWVALMSMVYLMGAR